MHGLYNVYIMSGHSSGSPQKRLRQSLLSFKAKHKGKVSHAVYHTDLSHLCLNYTGRFTELKETELLYLKLMTKFLYDSYRQRKENFLQVDR